MFPPTDVLDLPVAGSKTKQFEQIGNAVHHSSRGTYSANSLKRPSSLPRRG